jgi:outer membrane protein OmpA-like peptidoglycan-associated protein
MKKLSLSLVITLMCFAFTFAQEKKDSEPNKKWEIGINAGVDNFTGEYNMYKESRWNHYNHWKSDLDFGFGALVKKNFSHVFALEGDWNYTNLTGSWNENTGSFPDFKTRVSEFNLNSVWNLNNLFSKNKFERKIYWYAKLGLGESHIKNIASMSAATQGPDWRKAAWKPGYDLGTGVSFRLNDNFRLNVATQWDWIKTDRLDGKSEFIAPGGPNPTNGSITTKTGAVVPNVFGTKLYTSVGLSYTFGKKKKPAPVVVPPKPQPKPEPKPEPKPVPPPPPAAPVKPAVIGNVYKVYFAFDKYNLNDAAKADLDKLANDMNENPSVMLDVKSHTDCRGPASYNMKLSEKRGKAVIDYMISKGVSASRIHAQAFGETQPVNKCVDGVPCTKAEYALNRRTVSTITE